MKKIKDFSEKVAENVEKVIIGKREEVDLVLIALLCEGHVLVEDVPGVGKTMLAKAVARSIGSTFARLQFTPDLLPSDIIGVTIYNQKTNDFEFKPGPIHNHIILVDEINRGTPKTQSSLLECMEERQVSVDGITKKLQKPFLVIATQNPIEYEGTFPLPESQLDRFFLRIRMGYPDFEAENEILVRQQIRHPIEDLEPVVTTEELLEMQRRVKDVHLEPSLRQYIVNMVKRTRENSQIALGASPRGSLSLFKAAQARAAMRGEDYVIPDDIKNLVVPSLAHRMVGKYERGGDRRNIEGVLAEILETTPIPEGLQVSG